MAFIIEVPVDQNDKCTFSDAFPSQLSQLVDQMTYSAIIQTLNQSIKRTTYHPLFKALNFCGIVSLILPVVLTVHYNKTEWLLLWIGSLTFLLFSAASGFWWQVYQRRKSIQSSLIYINRQLINHQPPLSVRMYQEPLEYDRFNVGLYADEIEEIPEPLCYINRMHKTQFAGRKLFVEVGFSDEEQIPSTFAVDIPIDLSKVGRTTTTYCTIYPAILARIMSRDDYAALIQSINDAIHAVRPRWRVILFWMTVMIAVILMAAFAPNTVALVGAFMLIAASIGLTYELVRYANSLSRAAIPARERANARLLSSLPPMRLIPLSNHPNLSEILEQEQLYSNSPMMLVVGYQGSIDHSILIDNEREDARDSFIASTVISAAF